MKLFLSLLIVAFHAHAGLLDSLAGPAEETRQSYETAKVFDWAALGVQSGEDVEGLKAQYELFNATLMEISEVIPGAGISEFFGLIEGYKGYLSGVVVAYEALMDRTTQDALKQEDLSLIQQQLTGLENLLQFFADDELAGPRRRKLLENLLLSAIDYGVNHGCLIVEESDVGFNITSPNLDVEIIKSAIVNATPMVAQFESIFMSGEDVNQIHGYMLGVHEILEKTADKVPFGITLQKMQDMFEKNIDLFGDQEMQDSVGSILEGYETHKEYFGKAMLVYQSYNARALYEGLADLNTYKIIHHLLTYKLAIIFGQNWSNSFLKDLNAKAILDDDVRQFIEAIQLLDLTSE